jgi:hypothetical protein
MRRLRGLVLLLMCIGFARANAAELPSATVGMPARIEQLVLPGSELEVKPRTDLRTPIVLRIERVFPHGTAHRYDLVWYGLEAGVFDLRDYLQRKDGTPLTEVPSIRVEVVSTLPPGQVLPNELDSGKLPRVGGYVVVLATFGVLWIAGLAAIVLLGRKRKGQRVREALLAPSLAERLRPLVEAAMAGQLARHELALLERTLLAYWRNRLNLEHEPPSDAASRMRAHAEAGPLLRQLELWLHSPTRDAAVDVPLLLKPYQNLPPETLAEHERKKRGHTTRQATAMGNWR